MTTDVNPEKIRCDACPVMCFIAEGKSGACDRYANHDGDLIRVERVDGDVQRAVLLEQHATVHHVAVFPSDQR